jgi:CubicO group peptidase (beta-lactamase class C family)
MERIVKTLKTVLITATLIGQVQAHQPAPRSMVANHTSVLKIDHRYLENPKCRAFLQYAQNEMKTSGLIVLKDGEEVLELYGNGADKNTKTKVWSISKFLSGLMLGAKVLKYGMELMDTPLVDLGVERTSHPEDIKGVQWSDVHLRHVWNMSSGFHWCEYGNCRAVDAAKIMYGDANADATSYVLAQPLSHQPGTYYRYSAGNYLVLQQALKNLSRSNQEYLNSPYNDVLAPLGISKNEYAFEVDQKGIIMGGSGLSLTTSAFAKLGQLLLNRGVWGDQRIMSEEFFTEMTTNSEAIKNSPFAVQNWEGPSGGSIWLNDDSSDGSGHDRDGIPSFMPQSPYDMIYAGGNFGQFLLVYPSSNLVVARMGGDSPHSQHWVPFSNLALECFDPDALREDLDSGAPKVAPDTGKNLSLNDIRKEAILYRARVQELCSCLFVSNYKTIEECDKMVPTKTQLFAFLNSHNIISKPKVDWKRQTVSIKKRISRKEFSSAFNQQNPELGCRLR